MKKNIMFWILSIVFFSTAFSKETTDFAIFESDISTSFQDINQLEQYIILNPKATYNSIQNENPQLLQDLNLEKEIAPTILSTQTSFGGPIGIPSFLWGCFLGIIGLGIVYFVTEDSEETRKALWGCVLGTLIWGLSGVLFYWF